MLETMRPVVSVIVPMYNVERFLDQALASVEAQTLPELEIICVNDGSTDGSLALAREHASRDRRIRIIDKPNGGYGSACNCGIEAATGTWIAIVEPDDWVDPTMYASMVAHARRFNETIDIVKTPYWRVISPDTPEQHVLNCSYKGRIRPRRQPFTMHDAGVDHLLIHHPSIWSALYRRDFLNEKGIRFMPIPGAGWADNPFLVETLCQAEAIVYLDRAFYFYREETSEKTSSFARNNASVPFERWHDMMDVLERLGVTERSVLEAQYRRGFTYLDYIVDEVDPNDPRMVAIMGKMFARMHDDLVLAEPHIPPAWKEHYCEVKGLPAPATSKLAYAGTLVEAGLYSLRNIGPVETLKLMGAVAKRDKTAENATTLPEEPSGSALREGPSPCNPRSVQTGEGATCSAPGKDGLETKISIVIPVYNAAGFIGGCLDSVEGQTFMPAEIVCVDDGSTDSSLEILEKRAALDSRIRIVRKENGGPSSARNVGIQAATGDYVCFLDADDLLEPDACRRIAEEIERWNCDCVVFGWTCFPAEEANQWLHERSTVRDAFYPAFRPELVFREKTHPFLRLAVKRSLLMERGLFFDESLRVGEDSAFLFAVYPRAKGVRLVSDRLYRYRMPHEGSITSVSRDGTAEKCVEDLNMLVSVFEDWGESGLIDLCAPDLLHWVISFFLYTALRQPAPLRNELAYSYKLLLNAHFTNEELRGLALPPHDFKLIDAILAMRDSDDLNDRALSRAMLGWRLAEYGAADLAKTITSRLGL